MSGFWLAPVIVREVFRIVAQLRREGISGDESSI